MKTPSIRRACSCGVLLLLAAALVMSPVQAEITAMPATLAAVAPVRAGARLKDADVSVAVGAATHVFSDAVQERAAPWSRRSRPWEFRRSPFRPTSAIMPPSTSGRICWA